MKIIGTRTKWCYIALLLGMALSLPATARAATWRVDVSGSGDFTTIGAAVSSASVLDGDTIEVAPGTYTEGNVNINKSLTIMGANAGKPGTDASRGPESIWASTGPTIAASNVTLDGFTFSVTKSMGTSFDGTKVVNNIFDGAKPGATDGSGYLFALGRAGGAQNGFTFSDNWVKSTSTPGAIVYFGGAANRTINDFVFNGNTVDYCGVGQGYCVFLDAPNTSPVPTFNGVTIEGNTVLGGAIRVFNITSAANYTIRNNKLEAQYYSVMIGGNDGDISGNTLLSGPDSPSYSSSPIIFALSTFHAGVELKNVAFHDNTVYFSHATKTSYGILFSTSGGTVILDTLKTLPGLVSNFTAYDNDFVYAGAAGELHWDMQSGISNSYASAQKEIDLRINNFFWGAKDSASGSWNRMKWSEVYVRGPLIYYDWVVSFDTNGGYFDATQDMSQWNFDTNTPSAIGYERFGWRFDGLDASDPAKASLGIARALNDGARNTSMSFPFAAGDGSMLAGSIDAGDGSKNPDGSFNFGSIPTPEKDGYLFDGWYTDQSLTQAWMPQTHYVTADTTIYAKWIPIPTAPAAAPTPSPSDDPPSLPVLPATPSPTPTPTPMPTPQEGDQAYPDDVPHPAMVSFVLPISFGPPMPTPMPSTAPAPAPIEPIHAEAPTIEQVVPLEMSGVSARESSPEANSTSSDTAVPDTGDSASPVKAVLTISLIALGAFVARIAMKRQA